MQVAALKPRQTYVIAVSGGVDSVVLLNILVKNIPSSSTLVVAHLDHGIRSNSTRDCLFVKELAKQYKLKFETDKANLGVDASEATARTARYKFLNQVVKNHKGAILITAHHLDDFFETVVINFHRGCHRRGLVSLKSSEQLLRPLMRVSKQQIIDYAQKHQLDWVEDATNHDLKYLRNYIRHKIINKLTVKQRAELLKLCDELISSNQELDQFLDNYLKYKSYRFKGEVFSRRWFNQLNHTQACEVVATWLIKSGLKNYTQIQINYIVVKLKTLKPGKIIVVNPSREIKLTKRSLRLNF